MSLKNRKLFLAAIFFVIASAAWSKGKTENTAGEYFIIAEAYADLKKYVKAIEFYKKAAADESYANSANYNLARMYGLNNQWMQAAEVLKLLYNEAPSNGKIATAYAYALASSGDFDGAAGIYENIYSENKESPEHSFNYVRILIAVKKYEDAAKLLNELKETFTEDAEKKIIDGLEETINKIVNPEKETDKTQNKKEEQKQ